MPRTPNTRLAALLAQAGWNTSQLAAAVRVVAAEHGHTLPVDRSMVTRWLAGGRPRAPAPTYVLEALTRRLGRLVTAEEAGLTRTPTLVANWSWEVDPVQHLARLTGSQLDDDRGRVLGVSIYSLAALTIPPWEELTTPRTTARRSTTRGHRVGRAEVEATRDMTLFFARTSGQYGGGHARTTLTTYLADDVSTWLHRASGDAIRRQLLSSAAQLTIILGQMCADDGADALAQHYHRTAAHLAAEARDPHTHTVALRALATQAQELGHHRPALALALQAADIAARHTPPITQAYVRAQLAVAHAHTGDTRQALDALHAAERLHAHADQTPGPFTGYPTAALHYQRARVLAALGDHPAAETALTTSLSARASDSRRARALTTARLAETQLHRGHLEQALTTWQRFLQDHPDLRSTRSTRRLTTMRRLLRPYAGRPDAAHVLEQAADL
ncbi:tetratricopeptide repeat protein [Embleya sp. AB8]|uniref:tetratricopeptide repeat protein n=1 Tax=Embleya sp. AB8 TaxID=3156304 RepID=UPI003C769F63